MKFQQRIYKQTIHTFQKKIIYKFKIIINTINRTINTNEKDIL